MQQYLVRLAAPCMAALCATLPAQAQAQAEPCAPEAVPAASAPVPAGKFRLIGQLCPELVEPVRTHRAAQLDLYLAPLPMAGALLEPSPGAARAPVARVPLLPPPAPGEQRILALVPALNAAARAHGLDPLLLHAVAHVESRHNAQAVSPAGARGVMQVMPATASGLGVADPQRNLHDPGTNLNAGALYLRRLLARYQGNLTLTLAAYNAGEGAVAKYGQQVPPYPETQNYVKSVLAIYRRLQAQFGGAAMADAGATR